MAWRGSGAVIFRDGQGSALPFPGRADAFVKACALYAGYRERDLSMLLEQLGEKLGGDGLQWTKS